MGLKGFGKTVGLVLCAVLLGAQAIHSANAQKTEAKLDSAAIDRRLAQIVENQKTILKKLDAMAEELRIIKIRATN